MAEQGAPQRPEPAAVRAIPPPAWIYVALVAASYAYLALVEEPALGSDGPTWPYLLVDALLAAGILRGNRIVWWIAFLLNLVNLAVMVFVIAVPFRVATAVLLVLQVATVAVLLSRPLREHCGVRLGLDRSEG